MANRTTTAEELCKGFDDNINDMELTRLGGLMLLNAILMGVVVVIGAYAPQYRRHPIIGFIFLGASTLFLPIVSNVTPSLVNQEQSVMRQFLELNLSGSISCYSLDHISLVLAWTGIVLIIGINTSAVVAADAREGRNTAPPTELLVKTIWLAYLTLSTNSVLRRLRHPRDLLLGNLELLQPVAQVLQPFNLLVPLYSIIFARMLFKYWVFCKAQRSFAFGRNPRLLVGHMAQPQLASESQNSPTDNLLDAEHAAPSVPALVVMGEDTVKVEEHPLGHIFNRTLDQIGDRLVTLDRVWRFEDTFLRSTAPPKNLCFSFALFKLLRCRFTGYTAREAGFLKVRRFFQDTLLQGDDCSRAFRVVADELSFIHDYYYSSLPISYSHPLLPILSIILSLCTIAYCLCIILFTTKYFIDAHISSPELPPTQIFCSMDCPGGGSTSWMFGNLLFDAVPFYLVLALLVLVETRDIVFYVCSKWTKVGLICMYINRASWQRSPAMQKCIGFLLKDRRGKLVADKMNQCSILELHPRSILLRRLLCLRAEKKAAKVPGAVRATIFKALTEGQTNEQPSSKLIRPPSSPVSGSPIEVYCNSPSAHDGTRMAYTILSHDIATSIYEVRHPQPSDPQGHKIAATHLSRYCVYLVNYCPELLPDDGVWCKKLYKDVKKDVDRILRSGTAASVEYDQLVKLLSAESNHGLVKDGAKLGEQLVETNVGWEALARFWSEMILFVAPSENLEGHAEAIARGGEMITLIWAMVTHAGIVGRLDTAAATSSAARV